jgi:diadenosine tetraphosphatase ApaH/serine/threonine PP2A family protein phosphatase
LNKLDTEEFNAEGAHGGALDATNADGKQSRLSDNPAAAAVAPPFTLAHASPRHHLGVILTCRRPWTFAHFDTPCCLVGHTHVPAVFVLDETARELSFTLVEHGDVIDLSRHRLIVNPGGVGQPRDGDPRAAYALLDDEAMTLAFRRVAYDVAATQELMRAQNMPRRLIKRLAHGL